MISPPSSLSPLSTQEKSITDECEGPAKEAKQTAAEGATAAAAASVPAALAAASASAAAGQETKSRPLRLRSSVSSSAPSSSSSYSASPSSAVAVSRSIFLTRLVADAVSAAARAESTKAAAAERGLRLAARALDADARALDAFLLSESRERAQREEAADAAAAERARAEAEAWRAGGEAAAARVEAEEAEAAAAEARAARACLEAATPVEWLRSAKIEVERARERELAEWEKQVEERRAREASLKEAVAAAEAALREAPTRQAQSSATSALEAAKRALMAEGERGGADEEVEEGKEGEENGDDDSDDIASSASPPLLLLRRPATPPPPTFYHSGVFYFARGGDPAEKLLGVLSSLEGAARLARERSREARSRLSAVAEAAALARGKLQEEREALRLELEEAERSVSEAKAEIEEVEKREKKEDEEEERGKGGGGGDSSSSTSALERAVSAAAAAVPLPASKEGSAYDPLSLVEALSVALESAASSGPLPPAAVLAATERRRAADRRRDAAAAALREVEAARALRAARVLERAAATPARRVGKPVMFRSGGKLAGSRRTCNMMRTHAQAGWQQMRGPRDRMAQSTSSSSARRTSSKTNALPTEAAVRFATRAVDSLDATLVAAGAAATSSSPSSLPPPLHFGSAAASATAARLEAAASSLLPSNSSGLVSSATGAVKRAAEALSSSVASSPASSVFASRGGGAGTGASFSFPSFDPHFGSAALDAAVAAPGKALSATSAALASVAEALSGVAAGVSFSPPDFSSFNLDSLNATGLASALAAASAALSEAASTLGSSPATINNGDFPLPLVLAAALGSVAAAAASASRPGAQAAEANGEISTPASAPTFYTFESASAYWSSRPVAVAKRASALAAAAARVGSGILLDRVTGTTKENEALRAAALREELENAGPAFIKIAQAVSTRVDILSPAYVREIERLQDRVPPFDTALALREMAKEWGVRDVSEVVSEISPEPVAAASLGQVYKATLSPALAPRFYSNASSSTNKQALAGKQVAIKVQRPGVGEGILLDLLLLRTAGAALDSYGVLLAERRGERDGAAEGNAEAAAVAQARANARRDSGWAALLDAWGARFMEELDYTREAANASYVARQLDSLEGVVVPRPVASLSTGTVLVADWIEGERLSESTADDVLTLCTTLLNAYLVQLLEIGEVSGRLHGDAHEGNLLRTTGGQVAILDWGLVQEIPPHTSLALVEYIAHLSVGDWEGVCGDLAKLGFVPPGAPDPVEAGLAPALGAVLEQLSSGGGAKGVDVAAIQGEIEILSSKLALQIPSYFALILRTFSLIEGIALKADPSYSIVSKVFPYLARRLLTDDHPRARAALRQMLFGSEGRSRLDVARLRKLTSGFSNYRTDGLVESSGPAAAAALAATNSSRAPASLSSTAANNAGEEEVVIPKEAVELLALVFDPAGSYIQDIMIEEAAACADALSRDAARRAVAALAGIGGGGSEASGNALLRVEPGDDEALDNVRELVAFLADAASASAAAAGVSQGNNRGTTAPNSRGLARAASSARRLAVALRDLRPVAPALAAGIARVAEGIARALASRVIARLGAATGNRRGGSSSPAVVASYDADAAFRASAEGRRPRATTRARRPTAVVASASSSAAVASAAVAPPTGLFPAAAAAVLPVLLLPLTAPLWLAQQALGSLP